MLVPSRRLAVSAAVAVCLLAGCQLPSMSPTPAPTFRCTPEAGGAEYECSQHQYDEMVAKDKLYAEAEAVYRRFLLEEVRLLRLGGVEEPSPVINRTTNGAFKNQVMQDLRHAKADGVSVDAGSREVESVQRMVGVGKGGSLVALAVCVDSTSVHFTKKGKSAGFGTTTRDELYFGDVDGSLKIVGADGKEVPKC